MAKGRNEERRVKLPIPFDEAVKDLLQTQPPPEKKRRSPKPKAKSKRTAKKKKPS